MAYFYQKAREQNGENDISDTDFRYPGPKPQTKEAGILMLADSVEAASRSLKEPSVSRIKTLVSQIIDDRFQYGELDECPLTLRELNKIGEVFSKILIGWFHSRVVYPEDDKKVKVSEGNKGNKGENGNGEKD
jgi:membrane-associated HD superfamily phosphohydrolase